MIYSISYIVKMQPMPNAVANKKQFMQALAHIYTCTPVAFQEPLVRLHSYPIRLREAYCATPSHGEAPVSLHSNPEICSSSQSLTQCCASSQLPIPFLGIVQSLCVSQEIELIYRAYS